MKTNILKSKTLLDLVDEDVAFEIIAKKLDVLCANLLKLKKTNEKLEKTISGFCKNTKSSLIREACEG